MAAHDPLLDLICLAIRRSPAAVHLPEPELRAHLEPLVARDLGAGGALDLNQLWATLLLRPGVSERRLASAFARIEAHAALGPVPLVPTARLQVLNTAQREQLLLECPVTEEEAAAILRPAVVDTAEADAGAAAPEAGADADAADAAGAASDPAEEAARKAERGRAARALIEKMAAEAPPPRSASAAARQDQAKRPSRRVAALVVGLLLASGVTAYSFLDAGRYDLSSVTALQLSEGRREQNELQARIVDPRWREMTPAQRQQAVTDAWAQIQIQGQGISTLNLVDPGGTPAAVAGRGIRDNGVMLVRERGLR